MSGCVREKGAADVISGSGCVVAEEQSNGASFCGGDCGHVTNNCSDESVLLESVSENLEASAEGGGIYWKNAIGETFANILLEGGKEVEIAKKHGTGSVYYIAVVVVGVEFRRIRAMPLVGGVEWD